MLKDAFVSCDVIKMMVMVLEIVGVKTQDVVKLCSSSLLNMTVCKILMLAVQMTDHAELVAELARVEGMSMTERLKYAKKRRAVQLKKYKDFEKQHEKSAKVKKGFRKDQQTKDRNVRFSSSIVLLEAAARNDVAEGTLRYSYIGNVSL